MEDRDKTRFSEIMIGLADNFSAQVTKPGLAMRFDALRGYGIEQVATAAAKLILSREKMGMPNVAEMIREIEGPVRTLQDQASEQVSVVIKQIREVGFYRTPCFDDPLTRRLINSRWSWRSICSMTENELKWWAKEFAELYQSFSKGEVTGNIEYKTRDEGLRQLASKIGECGCHRR